MKKGIRINICLLVLLYIAYSVLSLLLFFFTSGGWTGFLYFVAGGLVYGFGFLLLCMGGIHHSLKSKISFVRVRVELIQAILMSHFFPLRLNRGDSRDSPWQYIFLGNILGDESFYNPSLPILGLLFLCVYLVSLAAFWMLTLAE